MIPVAARSKAVFFKLSFFSHNSTENKTCTLTTVTIQNMYTYHCHITKHVIHNTKHVHVPVSQYKTCTRTTVTIQNIYTYHYNNIKHVCAPPGNGNIHASFQDNGLPGCFAAWQVWSLQTCQVAEQLCGKLKFRSCYFYYLTLSDDRGETVFIFEQ